MTQPPLQAPRGTRDFYPEDLRLRSWLFGHFREVARRFAFEEVDAPVVEHLELFTRKAGEEIAEQLYHFEMHGRELALRPEMTPSIARMVLARAGSLRLPLRWFAVTQNWRYERMTRGRKREHFQWNMDVWGEPGVAAEAELLAAAFALLERVGLGAGEVRVALNSRALLEETLRAGVLRERPAAFEPLCVVIDKLAKIGADAVVDQLCDAAGPVRLERSEARDVVALLGVATLDDAAAAAAPGSRAMADLRRLFELLDAYGVADRVEFDASVVRGLAYYTGIVFEGFDAGRKLRAVFGGGRYDRLLETLGGPTIPAVGFGFGDVVVAELLADQGRLPALSRAVDDVVCALGEAQRAAAIRLAQRLRAEGRSVELVLGESRPKRVLEDADRAGARRALILGPAEAERGVVRVRELETGQERDEPLRI
ncbi:MAG TPA: histidine--tRNA ligase [Myxococcota bacterium]|nr:histidine--tRNA ligase [Myxococcota bacterium]